MKKTLYIVFALVVVGALIVGGLNISGYKLVKENEAPMAEEAPVAEKAPVVEEAPAAEEAYVVEEVPPVDQYDFPTFENQLGKLNGRNEGEIPFAFCNPDGNSAFAGFSEVWKIYPRTGLDHAISQEVQLMSICGESESLDGIDAVMSFFDFGHEQKDKGLNQAEFDDLVLFVYDGNPELTFEEMTVLKFYERDYQSAVLFGLK